MINNKIGIQNIQSLRSRNLNGLSDLNRIQQRKDLLKQILNFNYSKNQTKPLIKRKQRTDRGMKRGEYKTRADKGKKRKSSGKVRIDRGKARGAYSERVDKGKKRKQYGGMATMDAEESKNRRSEYLKNYMRDYMRQKRAKLKMAKAENVTK